MSMMSPASQSPPVPLGHVDSLCRSRARGISPHDGLAASLADTSSHLSCGASVLVSLRFGVYGSLNASMNALLAQRSFCA